MISVVIPLYNKEQSIVRTLDAVISQTYTDYEVLVINDGSTDQSAQVVETYLQSPISNQKSPINNQKSPISNPQSPISNLKSKIRLINKENGGVSSARNRGIQESQGEYIAFLDGDDLWEPTYLEEMAMLIADFPDAAIYGVGSAQMKNGQKGTCSIRLPNHFRGVVDNVWEKGRMMCYTSSSVCIPKRTIEFFDETLTHGEDLDVWFRVMLKGPSVFLNRTLSYYVQDSENRAMKSVPPISRHIVSVIDRYHDARMHNLSFRKAFDTQMVYFLYPYLFTRQYRKDARRLAEQLDYTQLKWSMRFRMHCPYLYRLYERANHSYSLTMLL